MNLRSRLSTLIAIRVVLVTLLMGSAILIQIARPGAFPVDPFFSLIGLTYALSVIYLATLRFADRHPWLVDLQFGADTLLVSAFIHVTGGVASNLSSLYLLPIIAASIVRHRAVATRVAVLSCALYLGVVTLQYVNVDLPLAKGFSPEVTLPTLRLAQYTVAVNLGGFVAVALLSGSLADSLRSTGARLENASHEIRDLRAFNEYVINSLLSGLITTDTEDRILTFNRAAAAISGVPVSEATGRKMVELMQIPEEARAQLPGLGEGRSLRVDSPYKTPDGRVIDLGLTISILTLPQGGRGSLLLFQDVTDVRRLERDMRRRQRLAATGEMAAGIAHEIRNPLASMSGSIQLLREELHLSNDQAQLMDIVLRESARLNDTIKSFLAYARPQRLALIRLDVRRVLEETSRLLRNSAEVRSDHVIELDVPSQPAWCEADENQIRQVVWNLATNGLRAMATGGRLSLGVAPESTAEGEWLVLTVRDQGCGIPADDLDHIFEPFRSSFERGTGLGLAVVHRVVTDNNGSIQVSSQVGKGTTVTVRLSAHGRQVVAPVGEPADRIGVQI